LTYSYRMNGALRVEFTYKGYDCEIELSHGGITTIHIDSLGCYEFDSDMCTLHHLTNFVDACIRQAS
jgi:hypothetical protein